MAENSENIEARLCAYVEGDLDEAGRVEIEKHLEAHPNHRRLLSELMATRDLLRFLPRESAPPELAETFNAHLERSALLDAPGAESAAPSLRGNLLPRVIAMAAIVLLTVGLGAIAYFALPKGTPELATSDHRLSPSAPVTTTPAMDESDAVGPTTSVDSRVLAKGGGAGTPERAKEFAKTAAKEAPDFSLTHESNTSDRFGGAGGGAAPVYLIVCTNDTHAAVREVTSNLLSNSIRWEPAPATPAESQLVQNTVQADPKNQVVAAPTVINSSSAYAMTQLRNARQVQTRQQVQVRQSQQQLTFENATDVGLYNRERAAKPSATEPAPAANTLAALNSEDKSKAAPSKVGASSADAAQEVRQSQSQLELESQQGQQQAASQPQQLAQSPETSDEVFAINAFMTRKQVEQISRALNRSSQPVELIADEPELQIANESLQLQRSTNQLADVPPPTPLASAAPRPAPVDEAEKADSSPAAAPADSGARTNGKFASRTPAPSSIAMKTGPRPTTGPSKDLDANQVASEAVIDAKPNGFVQRQAKGEAASKINARGGFRRSDELAPGSKIRISVDELKGSDIDNEVTVEVAADGTVSLPKVPPVRVAGKVREEAERAISDAYVNAKVVDSATVAVEPVLVAPAATRLATTVAQTGADAGKTAPTTGPTTQPQTQTSSFATTRPTTTTAPTEVGRLNVVILVQRNTVSFAETQPKTEPVDSPAQTPAPADSPSKSE